MVSFSTINYGFTRTIFNSFYPCGERGIRTLETLLGFTRFPSVRLQPLGHLSLTSHSTQFGAQNTKNVIPPLHKNQLDISPLNDFLISLTRSWYSLTLPNTNINLVIAASVVRSEPLITPIFNSASLVSYLPISTLPSLH